MDPDQTAIYSTKVQKQMREQTTIVVNDRKRGDLKAQIMTAAEISRGLEFLS